ncbi:hypothetical protein NYQ10_12535 [Flavobacterium johnsoniae]|uniref:hypothetical protein n=1 Tax=Flavobacterium johnsoniae TaxID=986 RepID=UPI0025AEEE78|nr:hypothetical protein [Flavobacterium johnsoniae]WJS92913.1 hypothetical protein NYQ10_12535 [Flavobacterium johnsoniae]
MIFEKPIILEGEEGNVVLIYGEHIIGNITKENADLSIERIDKNVFNSSEFESIININEIFEYEFEPENDSHIMFEVRNADSVTYKTIDFKDSETTRQAEKSISEKFKQLGFKREEKQITALSAAVIPGSVAAFVAVMGGIFTWYAKSLETRVITRTRIIKWYVYIFEKIAEIVGFYPFLIITITLTAFCLIWMFRRMSNPPIKISAAK